LRLLVELPLNGIVFLKDGEQSWKWLSAIREYFTPVVSKLRPLSPGRQSLHFED
jgi:hypothetical protein